MDLLREITLSLRSYTEAVRFIDQHKLWKLLIVPALCSLIIACFVAWFAWKTSAAVTDFAVVKFNLDSSYSYMNTFLEFIVFSFIRLIIIFTYIKLYRYLLLIILAPEFSYIISVVQSRATETRHEFKVRRFIFDVWRSIKLAIRNFLIELILTLLIIIFGVIVTWLIPIIPILLLLFEGYFFGYSLADFRNEFMNLRPRESKSLINDHKGLVIGHGIVFNFSLLIPIIGILFSPTISIIAMGLSLNELEEKSQNYYASSIS